MTRRGSGARASSPATSPSTLLPSASSASLNGQGWSWNRRARHGNSPVLGPFMARLASATQQIYCVAVGLKTAAGGRLPAGIHLATWEELVTFTGTSPY